MTRLVDHRGRPRVVVTGMGAITPCGNNLDEYVGFPSGRSQWHRPYRTLGYNWLRYENCWRGSMILDLSQLLGFKGNSSEMIGLFILAIIAVRYGQGKHARLNMEQVDSNTCWCHCRRRFGGGFSTIEDTARKP